MTVGGGVTANEFDAKVIEGGTFAGDVVAAAIVADDDDNGNLKLTFCFTLESFLNRESLLLRSVLIVKLFELEFLRAVRI